MNDFTVLPPGVVKSAGALPAFGATDGSTLTAILAEVRPAAQRERGLAGGLAQLVAVLPDVDVLLAQGDVVQVGRVAVLAAERRDTP